MTRYELNTFVTEWNWSAAWLCAREQDGIVVIYDADEDAYEDPELLEYADRWDLTVEEARREFERQLP